MKKLGCLLLCWLALQHIGFASTGSGGSSKPAYYSYEDLKGVAEKYSWYFSFDNTNRPSEAMASLPYYPAESWYCKMKRMNPFYFSVPQALTEYTFPWDSIRWYLNKGDLVFLRCGGLAGYVVRFFSSFTHVAMVYDADDRETFESLKMRGVDVYTLNDKPWEHIVTYAVKRIKPEILASYDISNTVESALTLYRHKPYFPNVNTTYSTDEFFKKWSDKNDMDSMYCSKLVYHTFKNHDINFDTNRTRVWGGYFSAPDYNYNGIYVSDAWIGVSPDDVYYSDALMNDLYIGGAESLDDVLSDSYF